MTTRQINIGDSFSSLAVASDVFKSNGKRYVKATCACGQVKSVRVDHLITGAIKSCGCHRRAVSRAQKTHGMAKTTEYEIWCSMKKRCFNEKCAAYKNYGGRGITVCEEWLSFESFYRDMGPRPPGASIDRIDNSKGYSKENCRWSDSKTQSSNRRNVKVFDVNGVRGTMPDLCKIFGVKRHTVWARINSGVDVVTAFTRPVHGLGSHGNSTKTA